MTTIAYRDGILAADDRMDYHYAVVTKLFKLPDDSWVGGAGTGSGVRMAVDLLSNAIVSTTTPDKLLSKPIEDIQLLRVYPDGSLSMYFPQLVEIPLANSFFAIGSGSDYAMGAMSAGASAEQAIRVAGQYDKGTGDRVQVEYVRKEDKAFPVPHPDGIIW